MKKFMLITSIFLIPVFVISALCLAFKDTWFKKDEKQIIASASGSYDYSKIESSLEDAKATCEFEISLLKEEVDELKAEIEEQRAIGEDVSALELKVTEFETEINRINDELLLILTRLDIINGSISNENILINGEFDVNQRGSETYTISSTATTYTLDRWASNTTGAVITKTDTGVSITASDTDVSFFQYVEADVLNKLLTFSIMFEDDTLEFVTATLTDSEIFVADFETSKLQLSVAENGFCKVEIIVKANNSISVRYAKLEVGELWTLYTPQNVGDELLSCQRYYFTAKNVVCFGSVNGGGGLTFNYSLPVELRNVDKVNCDLSKSTMFGGGEYYTLKNYSFSLGLSAAYTSASYLCWSASKFANYPLYTAYSITNVTITADAEIY